MDQHSCNESFDTEILMRDHWLTCLKIPQSDGYSALLMPDATKEPAPRMRLPTTIMGDRGRSRTEPLLPRSDGVAEGESDSAPLDTLNDELEV